MAIRKALPLPSHAFHRLLTKTTFTERGLHHQANIVLSEERELHKDVFWEVVEVLSYDSIRRLITRLPDKVQVINPLREGTEDEHLWVEVTDQKRSRVATHICPEYPSHVVTPLCEGVAGDVWGGPQVASIVYDSSYGHRLLAESATMALKQSPLTGYQVDSFKIKVNQSNCTF